MKKCGGTLESIALSGERVQGMGRWFRIGTEKVKVVVAKKNMILQDNFLRIQPSCCLRLTGFRFQSHHHNLLLRPSQISSSLSVTDEQVVLFSDTVTSNLLSTAVWKSVFIFRNFTLARYFLSALLWKMNVSTVKGLIHVIFGVITLFALEEL